MTLADTDSRAGTLSVINPYDLSEIDTVPAATRDDAERAMETTFGLFRDRGAWLPAERRLAVLEGAAILVATQAGLLADTIVREGGKPRSDSAAEVAAAGDALKAAAAVLRTDAGQAVPMGLSGETADRLAFTRYEPAGVVLVIPSFCEPLGGAVRAIAAAIAAGCPTIVCPAAEAPLSCLAFTDLLQEAGLPRGWVQAVVDADGSLGAVLAADARLGYLSFAGDAETGWALRSRLAPGARCGLLHGTSAPVVVAGDVDVYEVREAVLKGCFAHAGQLPVSVRRIFAHTKVATRFATQLAMKASGLLVGDPQHPDTDVGPMISPDAAARLHDCVREAVSGGGQLLTGGERLTETLYPPTVIFDPPPDCRLMTAHVPGPVVCVDPWFRVEDALARANSLAGAGPAAVFTRDIDRAMEIAAGLDASAVMVNDHTAFGAAWAPSAGLREAGLGRAGVPSAIREMQSEKMTVLRTAPLTPPPDAGPA